MTTVVGLDISLTSTGVAQVVSGELVEHFAVKTVGKKGDSLFKRAGRLTEIERAVVQYILDDYVDLVVVEAPSFGSKFGSPHDRSGLWWAVVNACFNLGIPVAQVSPQGRAKYGTGKGNSKKAEVLAAAKHRYGIEFKTDDEADAVLLACMGSRWLGHPVENFTLPPNVATAMDGVEWPDMDEWGEKRVNGFDLMERAA